MKKNKLFQSALSLMLVGDCEKKSVNKILL